MGEATFYLKAEFTSEKEARDTLPLFKELLIDQSNAYEYWQKYCREDPRMEEKDRDFLHVNSKTPPERYELLKEKFELAFSILPAYEVSTNDKNMNFLAGQLYDGGLEQIEDNLDIEDTTIYFHAEVWHFSTWDHLSEWLRERGSRAGWLSDEYATIKTYYDQIEYA